jgi:ATP-dependent helicase HrpB
LLPLVACLAFPDRIAQKRGQGYGQFLLANGHGAFIDESQPLAGCDYVVALDLMRSLGSSNQISQSSRIFCALDLDIVALESQFGFLFATSEQVDWDEKAGRLVAEERFCVGEVVVRRRTLPEPDKQKMTQALLNYVESKGLSVLNWSEQTVQWLERVRCGIEWLDDEEWPAMDDASLLSELREWLEPYLIGITSVKALHKVPLIEALNSRLGWPLNQQIDEWLPVDHVLPTGTHKRIRYQCGKEPVLSVRMQEVFGEKTSPVIAKGRQAIVMELLSPAQRPLQVTRDLAGFWAGAYKEVQKEMKGRYPKHVWPDDPANHVATTKTKRQLNS